VKETLTGASSAQHLASKMVFQMGIQMAVMSAILKQRGFQKAGHLACQRWKDSWTAANWVVMTV